MPYYSTRQELFYGITIESISGKKRRNKLNNKK